MRFFTLLLQLIFFTGCNLGQIGTISTNKILSSSPQVNSVLVVNDQFIVNGSNLQDVTEAKIEGTANHSFDIESKTYSQLVLNARSTLSLLVGGTFDLIISSANGAATFPVSFTLSNGQVTAAQLNNMGASAGQVLRFNGTNWGPASISSGLMYTGTYNATTNSPNVVAAGGPEGTFYIVNVAGTQDFGAGAITFAVGDWVIYDGTAWSKVPLSGNSVTSFNGRTGVVTPLANDYTWSMLQKTSGKLTGSKISEIEDVDVTGLADGYILRWQTNKWIVTPETSPAVQSAAVASTGGSVISVSQTGTNAASSPRSAVILQNNGTGGTNEYNLIARNASGATTFSIDQAGSGSFSGSVTSSILVAPNIYGSTAALGNLVIDSTSNVVKGHTLIAPSGGYVGIGTNTPASALNVEGAIVSNLKSNALAVTDINFLTGNVQVSLNATNNAAFRLCGLKDGGTYTLILKAQPNGSVPTFTAFTNSDCTGAITDFDTGGTSFLVSSPTVILNFVRAGTTVYAMFASGFTK